MLDDLFEVASKVLGAVFKLCTHHRSIMLQVAVSGGRKDTEIHLVMDLSD